MNTLIYIALFAVSIVSVTPDPIRNKVRTFGLDYYDDIIVSVSDEYYSDDFDKRHYRYPRSVDSDEQNKGGNALEEVTINSGTKCLLDAIEKAVDSWNSGSETAVGSCELASLAESIDCFIT